MIRFSLNKHSAQFDDDPNRMLLFVLRNDYGLLGAKFGCGLGLCGACSVLIDGVTNYSCNMPMWAVEGREVETIEGLQEDPSGALVMGKFEEKQAFQCGYCTSGMVVAATAIARESKNLSDETLKGRLARNLCRCGTHNRILAAMKEILSEVSENGR